MSRDMTAIPPVHADDRMRYGPFPSEFFDLWQAQGTQHGVAVMIHGGFWRKRYDLLHTSHLCAALAQQGISVVNLEYRRVGEMGGGWPESFHDVKLGIDTVTQHLKTSPVVLGHSAGGHLALRLASEMPHLPGVVGLAPVADLRLAHELNLSNGAVREFLGVDPDKAPEILRDADPLQHAAGVPVILVHGIEDVIVPLQLSRNYLKARGGDVPAPRLLALENADHFDVIDPDSAAFPIIRECVMSLLQPSSATNRSTNR
jgi:acetyl esterase/lipase